MVDVERLLSLLARVDDSLVADHLANLPTLRRFVAAMTGLL